MFRRVFDVTGWYSFAMTSFVKPVVSVAVGAGLALIAVIGGVQAVSPGANPASASEQVILYDAP